MPSSGMIVEISSLLIGEDEINEEWNYVISQLCQSTLLFCL